MGEHVVARAMEMGARASVLRIGQVVGDTKWGLWNDGEFLPMVFRSSLVLGVLPLLEEVSFGFFFLYSHRAFTVGHSTFSVNVDEYTRKS